MVKCSLPLIASPLTVANWLLTDDAVPRSLLGSQHRGRTMAPCGGRGEAAAAAAPGYFCGWRAPEHEIQLRCDLDESERSPTPLARPASRQRIRGPGGHLLPGRYR